MMMMMTLHKIISDGMHEREHVINSPHRDVIIFNYFSIFITMNDLLVNFAKYNITLSTN